jgi:hypothetical protein
VASPLAAPHSSHGAELMPATKAPAPRVTVVTPGDVPALMSAVAAGNTRAAQRARNMLAPEGSVAWAAV